MGKGAPKDNANAAAWFDKAAAQGHMQAQLYLGEMYQKGLGVKQNDAVAKEWYAKAASRGSKEAKSALEKMQGQSPKAQ